MAVMRIKISNVAYARLRRLKRPGESFSDLVIRLTEGRRSAMHLAGSWKDMPPEQYRKLIRSLREEEKISERKMRRRSNLS